MANYTCVAENIAGKRLSDPVSLTVYGKFSALWCISFQLVRCLIRKKQYLISLCLCIKTNNNEMNEIISRPSHFHIRWLYNLWAFARRNISIPDSICLTDNWPMQLCQFEDLHGHKRFTILSSCAPRCWRFSVNWTSNWKKKRIIRYTHTHFNYAIWISTIAEKWKEETRFKWWFFLHLLLEFRWIKLFQAVRTLAGFHVSAYIKLNYRGNSTIFFIS